MKLTRKYILLLLFLGVTIAYYANEKDACIKACNIQDCKNSSPSVCAKEKQECRNKCPQ